jgi:hypothetical protein
MGRGSWSNLVKIVASRPGCRASSCGNLAPHHSLRALDASAGDAWCAAPRSARHSSCSWTCVRHGCCSASHT